MSAEITLDAARQSNKPLSPLRIRLRTMARRTLLAVILLALAVSGWYVWRHAPYTSDSDLAYYLGLAGGLLMLVLLVYPLRKRFRILHYLGPLRYWFRFHMLAGVLGPTLVLYHSTFQVRSFNAAIALASLLLVVASGLVGRLLYRRIHRGLYGKRATLEELQQTLETQLEAMRSSSSLPDEVKQEIECFAQLVSSVPANRAQRIAYFVTLGFRRRRAYHRARRALTKYAGSPCTMTACVPANPVELLRNIDAALGAAQAAAQFSSYERLFSYWHTVHIPFLFMLLITAVVHVVAVHAY